MRPEKVEDFGAKTLWQRDMRLPYLCIRNNQGWICENLNIMRRLLLTTALLSLLPGCVIHEPTYYIIYTPEKPLTNNAAGAMNGQSRLLASQERAGNNFGAFLSR